MSLLCFSMPDNVMPDSVLPPDVATQEAVPANGHALPILRDVPLDDLIFDPQNPRLPGHLQGAPDAEVFSFLLLQANLIELMLSIREKGYFAGEPLMVVPNAEGKLTVVEGNRRLAALKLLSSTTPTDVLGGQVQSVRAQARFKPVEIPVLEFLRREDILVYLGYRHITGIKEWDALAKAKYLRQLRDRFGEDDVEAHKALAKEIGSKASTVAKWLTGYTLLVKAKDLGILNELGKTEDQIPFSLLTTGIGWENISSFIGLKSSSDVAALDLKEPEFREFFSWVFEKQAGRPSVLGESRNFEKLARIVDSESALKALRRGEPLATADLLTSGPLEAVRKFLQSAESSIKNAQDTINYAEGLTPDDAANAERLRKASISLHSAIKALTEVGEGD